MARVSGNGESNGESKWTSKTANNVTVNAVCRQPTCMRRFCNWPQVVWVLVTWNAHELIWMSLSRNDGDPMDRPILVPGTSSAVYGMNFHEASHQYWLCHLPRARSLKFAWFMKSQWIAYIWYIIETTRKLSFYYLCYTVTPYEEAVTGGSRISILLWVLSQPKLSMPAGRGDSLPCRSPWER